MNASTQAQKLKGNVPGCAPTKTKMESNKDVLNLCQIQHAFEPFHARALVKLYYRIDLRVIC